MAARKKANKGASGGGGWLLPALLGTATVVGVGLASRKASAKPGTSTPPLTPTPPTPTPIPTPAELPPNLSPVDNGPFEVRFPVYQGQDGAFMLEQLLGAAQLDKQWKRLFKAIGRGESGFDSNVVLGDPRLYPAGSQASKLTDKLGPGEARGARKAYERGFEQGRYEGCPWDGDAFSWGSGGWFGMLPANAWYAYLTTGLRCRHPHYLLHPVDQLVVGVDFARRLMRWSAFKNNPRWLTLRVGWGNPSAMDDPQAHERVGLKFSKHLQAEGVDPAWMNEEVTPLVAHDIEALWERLMTSFDLEPGRKGA